MSDILERAATAYMNRQFVIVDENTNVAASVQQMNARKTDTIIATREGTPVGIATDSDILDKVVMAGEDSDEVYLRSIITSPLITLSARGTVGQAIQLMRINGIKRIPITHDGSIIGLVTQHSLANAVRASVIERTFRTYRSAIRERYKPVIGNLGFILQFAGILMIAPALLGTALGEGLAATGIYLSVVSFSALGFILNSYGEKRPLNLKQASVVVVSSFILLSLFGAIPYIYVNPFWQGIDPLSLFLNSFFESTSGFTTTGLSLIMVPEDLPQTLVFYRSYTQWVGGLSFIYLVMTLFYPERKLSAMKSVLGGGLLRFKQMLVTVAVIFSAYTAALILLLLFFTGTSDIYAISLVFSAVTGGGFVPDSNIVSSRDLEGLMIIGGGMIISALPFAFHYSVFSKGSRTRRVTSEVAAYLILLVAATPLFGILYDETFLEQVQQQDYTHSLQDSAFHVVSASTNSGFQYIDIPSLSSDSKLMVIVLMLVGGTAFSTAGGIKVGRFLLLFQRPSKRKMTMEAPSSFSSTANPQKGLEEISEEHRSRKPKRLTTVTAKTGDKQKAARNYSSSTVDKAVRESMIVIASFMAFSATTGFGLSYLANATLEDGIFESVSALTTTGLSTGITSMDLDLLSKSLLITNMIVGRFEVIAVLYIFFGSLRH
jgi:trk system potassium uptake protein TrkH